MQLNVVFVDDELELCELFSMLLGSDQVHITTFCNPLQAIEFINKNNIDIVFLDYRMPQINGFECRDRIDSSIPCYLVTGENGLEVPDTFIAKFSKPFEIRAFEEILDNLLVQKAS